MVFEASWLEDAKLREGLVIVLGSAEVITGGWLEDLGWVWLEGAMVDYSLKSLLKSTKVDVDSIVEVTFCLLHRMRLAYSLLASSSPP